MPDVASGWGRLDFGQSIWGEATILNTGWGATNFGENEWGDLSNVSFTLTGVSTTTAIGSVSITVENFAGWGSDTWGFENWGESSLDVSLTGVSVTSSVGAVNINETHLLTGLSTTSSVGR